MQCIHMCSQLDAIQKDYIFDISFYHRKSMVSQANELIKYSYHGAKLPIRQFFLYLSAGTLHGPEGKWLSWLYLEAWPVEDGDVTRLWSPLFIFSNDSLRNCCHFYINFQSSFSALFFFFHQFVIYVPCYLFIFHFLFFFSSSICNLYLLFGFYLFFLFYVKEV